MFWAYGILALAKIFIPFSLGCFTLLIAVFHLIYLPYPYVIVMNNGYDLGSWQLDECFVLKYLSECVMTPICKTTHKYFMLKSVI